MSGGYSFAGHVGFAKEASGGTGVAATNYIEALSENLIVTKDRFDTKNIVGRYHEPDDSPGLIRVGGDVVFPAVPDPLGFFLLGVTGVQSNAVVLSGFLHTHNFTGRTADWDTSFALQPYTFEIFRDVTSAQRYLGCVMAALGVSIAPNQDARCSVSVIGKSASQITGTTPSFVNSPTQPLAFDTCSISLGGAASAQIEAINFSLNNNLEGIPTLNNSTNVQKIRRNGPIMTRLSGQIAFEDITEYNNFINDTEQAVLISLFRAGSFQMIIDIPRFIYTTFPLGMGGRDRQVVAFDGTARFHTGSNQAYEIRLTNTTSGY